MLTIDINGNLVDSDSLYHHGILGMKWGKRNGPPYPLRSGDHSQSEKKAGWKKSLGGGRNEELYSQNKTESSVTKKSKSGLVSGDRYIGKEPPKHKQSFKEWYKENEKQIKRVAVTTAALATWVAAENIMMQLNDSDSELTKKLVNWEENIKFKKFRNNPILSEPISNYESLKETQERLETYQSLVNEGFNPLVKNETFSEGLKAINEEHWKTPDGKSNCVSCSIAHSLRDTFHLDVTAKSASEYPFTTLDDFVKIFKDGGKSDSIKQTRYTIIDSSTAKNQIQKLFGNTSEIEGASGTVSAFWNSAYGGGGHNFNWRCKNGEIEFFDSQTGWVDVVKADDYFTHLDLNEPVTFTRLDNAKFNMDELTKYVKYYKY